MNRLFVFFIVLFSTVQIFPQEEPIPFQNSTAQLELKSESIETQKNRIEPEAEVPAKIEKISFDDEIIMEADFFISEISDSLFEKMKGKSYKNNCTIPLSDLRLLHVLHKTIDGQSLEGELICNKIIADSLLEIFKELYKADYPIEKICLIDAYDADDEKSMADNNSSCFNFRFISYTQIVSKHGAGLAVDINPLYNPYVKTVRGKQSIEPANGKPFVDRTKSFPYKITHDDLAFKLFTERGFEWGGDWDDCKDYQHFEWPSSK